MNLHYYAPQLPLHLLSERTFIMDNMKDISTQGTSGSMNSPLNIETFVGMDTILIETTKFSDNLNELFQQWFPSKQKMDKDTLLDSIYLNNLISPDSKLWVKFTMSHIILCAERCVVNLHKLKIEDNTAGLHQEIIFVKTLCRSIVEYLQFASKVIASYVYETPVDPDESREVTRELLSRIYRENEMIEA